MLSAASGGAWLGVEGPGGESCVPGQVTPLSPSWSSLLQGDCAGCTTRSGLAAEPPRHCGQGGGSGDRAGAPTWIGTDLLGGWFMAELWVHPGAASLLWVSKGLGVHVLPWAGPGPPCPYGHRSPHGPLLQQPGWGWGHALCTPRAPALPGSPVHEEPLAAPPQPEEPARNLLEFPGKLQHVGLMPR